jgi:hypothetical protein
MSAVIITALVMGSTSVLTSNATTQAKVKLGSPGCYADRAINSTTVAGRAITCYQIQVAAKCYWGSGVYSWVYGVKGSTSKVGCPDVRYGAIRGRLATTNWGSWDYFR